MTERKSDLFKPSELDSYSQIAIRYLLHAILKTKCYFNPKSIRNEFLDKTPLSPHQKEELKGRFLRYTRYILRDLLMQQAIEPYSRYTYRILNRAKILNKI